MKPVLLNQSTDFQSEKRSSKAVSVFNSLLLLKYSFFLQVNHTPTKLNQNLVFSQMYAENSQNCPNLDLNLVIMFMTKRLFRW